MNVDSVLIIGPPASFPTALDAAVQQAFPQVNPIVLSDLAAVGEQGRGNGVELLLLAGDAGPAAFPPEERLDAENLPRWGILRFGSESPAIAPLGWTVPQLVPLLREAAARHRLSRESARLRGELLTMARRVSHDLRTPLGGILATVDMLPETLSRGGASTQSIFSSVDEITKIINRTGFLLKAIAEPLPRKTVNMGMAVQAAIARLERFISEKQAALYQPPSWPEVEGVAPWLELIWWNLLHNALQHTGPSPVISLGWEKVGQGHHFWIRDSGPGFKIKPPHDGFCPFHLLHDPNASHGLGLPIVRRLTELQGGHCGYTPEENGGSIFHFTLIDSQA